MNILDLSWIAFIIYAMGAGFAAMIILDRILGEAE